MIKSVRLRFGIGLRDAKDFVDSYKVDPSQHGYVSEEPWYGPNE